MLADQSDVFARALERGRAVEQLAGRLLQARGAGVIFSSDYAGPDGEKVPRLMFRSHGLVIPDLDLAVAGKRFWCEVKGYWAPRKNRQQGCMVHGIRRLHYRDYGRVVAATGTPCLLAIIEIESGDFLMQRLDALRAMPCQCAGCRGGGDGARCRVIPTDNVYFDRDAFKLLGTIPDRLMAPVRVRWSH